MRLLLLPLCMAWASASAAPQDPAPADPALPALAWRELGPSTFSGRIVDIGIRADDPLDVLAASASGGLWRSRNEGVTWDRIFQHEASISIGDIAWDPADPDVIWVGTGEANNQRSSYWGNGIYRTTDGGKTWSHLGLDETHHIGRIVLHPDDSRVAFVAALGHLYTANEERGLYRTDDAGGTWTKVLDLGPTVGVVDVALDPADPDTVLAASYERLRRAWDFDGNGPGSAIHRSTDGGATWQRCSGLPEGDIGRIGLTAFPGRAGVFFASISDQNRIEVAPDEDPTLSLETRFAKGVRTVTAAPRGGGAHGAGLREGDVLVSLAGNPLDRLWSWSTGLAAMDPDAEVELVVRRGDEERTLRISRSALQLAVDRTPTTREVGGSVWITEDGGASWEKRSSEPIGGNPAYYYGQIRVDPSDEARLYVCGVPLSWSDDGGRSWDANLAQGTHVDHHAVEVDPRDGRRVWLGNDGGLHLSTDRGRTWRHFDNLPLAQFYAVGLDQSWPFRVYGGTQDNGTWGGPSTSRDPRGIGTGEWYRVGGGDGFYAQIDPEDPSTVYGESQFGWIYRRDVDSWSSQGIQPRAPEGEEYRFNWNSPILLSRHNPRTVWFGGNRLFKSLDRGDTWSLVTEDLTTANPEKIAGNVPHCTITTVAESAFEPDTLMVGTDDGLVQLTRDGGHTWTNLSGKLAGLPNGWWVSRVVLSEHAPERAFVTCTGYREDDFRPMVWRTEDLGRTWTRIDAGLPHSPVNVIAEDPAQEGILYVGTEHGVQVSLDGGATWSALGSGLPTIAVHDLKLHARDRELVLATHGRGFWSLDVAALAHLDEGTRERAHALLPPADLVRWQRRSLSTSSGHADWFGSNPEGGAAIHVWVGDPTAAPDGLTVEVLESGGRSRAKLEVPAEPGLHRLLWTGPRRRWSSGPAEGEYTLVLRGGAEEQRATLRVVPDPITAPR